MKDFAESRDLMLARQIAGRGVRAPQVLAAMREVAREDFVPSELRESAYADSALPIALGQTISQPYVVACMIEAAGVRSGDRVLEIGTGTGYSAAVVSRIAHSVDTVERLPDLATAAALRLADLGYHNVTVHIGDGTKGWPAAAPFDAIIVTAGGPDVPLGLRNQLAAGGRLVMPVGNAPRRQRLLKVTRDSRGGFSEKQLEDVVFVPLIGEYGWQEGEDAIDSPVRRGRADVPAMIRAAANPLPACADPSFGAMFDRFGDSRVVLLGEATHGTAEFYQARAAITRRLIEQHGFDIVAVEADWPDAASIDRYVRHRPGQRGARPPFRRFPSWMWRNTDVDAFTEWLREHNEGVDRAERVGFYGLDLYSLSASISAVLGYLDGVDPEAAALARERYACLDPWHRDPGRYGRMSRNPGFEQCEGAVVAQLGDLLAKRLEYTRLEAAGGESFLDAAQNARLVTAAERYYRAMYQGSATSWNLRDTHMFETLVNLLDARGPHAKAVVWAHNSHIGNAAATDMGREHDELNIGQLCRARFGADAALIGLSTHAGTVAAASYWDGPMEIKQVLPSREDSYEFLAHQSGVARFLLDLTPAAHPRLHEHLREMRLERFIGVIYRPESELHSHYVRASLPGQFDALLWFDETHAVTAIPGSTMPGPPDTYPSGM